MDSYISIQGNIGAGKSTFIQQFAGLLPKIQWVLEPVEEWRKLGPQSFNVLQNYYEDPQRWGFSFQIFATATRIQKLFAAFQSQQKQFKHIIMQRSPETDKKVFSLLMKNLDYMNHMEFQMFRTIYPEAEEHHHKIIYLKCSPETCLKRIEERRRPEQASIPLEYLKIIDDLHEKWISETQKQDPHRVLIINTQIDYRDKEILSDLIKQITEFIDHKTK